MCVLLLLLLLLLRRRRRRHNQLQPTLPKRGSPKVIERGYRTVTFLLLKFSPK